MATRRRISPASALSTVAVQPESAQDLLRIALGKDLTLNIPDDAKMQDIETTLKFAITGWKRLTEATERLKPIIGRLLYVINSRRLYRPDYRNLTDYIERKVTGEFGLSRTNAFEALRIAKAFPSMSMEEYQKYGASRLLLAASITDESDPQAKSLLDSSTRVTVEEFSETVKDMKSSTAEPAKTFTVSFRLPLEWKARWDDLLTATDLSASDLLLELIKGYIETHPAKPAAKESGKPAHAKAS